VSAPAAPRWRSILALVVVLLFAGAGMAQMNQLLEGMRLSGRPANTLADLGPPFRAADTERTKGVLDVWREHAAEVEQPDATTPPTADALLAGRWFVLLDALLFAPAYWFALILFFRRAQTQIPVWERAKADAGAGTGDSGGQGRRTDPREIANAARAGIVLIAAAFAFDELENLLYWLILERGWSDPSSIGSSRLWLLAVASSLKWFAGFLAGLVALFLGWRWAAARVGKTPLLGSPADRARLRLVVPQLLLVLLFGVALSGHEQLTDLMRRWTVVQLVLSFALASLFGLVVWLTTRRLLATGQWTRNVTQQRRVTVRLAWSIVIAALIQLTAFWLLRDESYHPGWGLAVPLLIVTLLALLSVALPDEQPISLDELIRRKQKAPVPAEGVAASRLALPRALASAALLLFAFGVFQAAFGYAVYSRDWHWDDWHDWLVLIPLAAVLAAILVAKKAGRKHVSLWAAGAGTLAMLALAPLDRQDADPSLVTVAALLVALAGWRLYDLLKDAPEPMAELRFKRATVAGLLVAIVLLALVVVVWPIPIGQALGVVGLLALFLIALALLVAMLVWLNGAIRPPLALRELGFVRFPLLSFFAIWFLAASLADRGGFHDLRIEPAARRAAAPTLERAFDCWLAKNGQPALGSPAGCAGAQAGARARAQPLILVASTGGGIRAAYWTAVALDCAFERDLPGIEDPNYPCPEDKRTEDFSRSDSLFALSGISGGSVGLAAYAAHLSEKEAGPSDGGWVNNRLSADALSPTGAWWLFLEFPRVFLQFDLPTDRSEILETTWEQQWPQDSFARGLFELWREEAHVPLLLLNATSVADGCRFNVSVLDGNIATTLPQQPNCRAGTPFDEAQTTTTTTDTNNDTDIEVLPTAGEQELLSDKSTLAATRDLSDFLCRDHADVPLSAAAFLSSRFPFVNPSGRIEGRCKRDPRRPLAYVVDGGYLDTSAGSTAAELSDELEPLISQWNTEHAGEGGCIVPFLIQIDNGFEDEGRPRPSRRPNELTIPLSTLFQARTGRAAQGRAAAALAYNRPYPASLEGTPLVDRYAHFVNQAHPGPRSPLGWVQSRASERELRDQILQKKNRQALHEVRRWLSGTLACSPPTP
jgi:hypothetical protein